MTDDIDRAQAREAELLADALRDHARRAGLAQHLAALRFKAAGQGRIVAHPHLEQIAQHEHRVGRRVAQVARPGVESEWLLGLEVQV